MKEFPLISVVVPVFKVEKYLNHCIRSITKQSYRNLEIILVDDGSPDGSGAICDAWAAKDSRVRVIHKENGGGGQARNRALDEARGMLIAFVDSDDYVAPDMLQHLYSMLEQGADIAECGYLQTDHDHAVFNEGSGKVWFYTASEAMACHIQDTVFRQVIWNKLYRREVIGDVRFPAGTKIDDEFFTYRVLGNAKRLIRSDKQCYAYRQQPDSVMHQKNPVKSREGIQAKQQRLAYLQTHMPQLENEAKVELMLSCVYAMQTCLRELPFPQRRTACEDIRAVMEDVKPIDLSTVSRKQQILLRAAQRWPEAVSTVLNYLIDIHVLT